MTTAVSTRAMVVGAVKNWADRGWLRRLDAALARFVADLSPDAAGEIVLVTALVAHLEGRGHTCLPIESLLDDPQSLFDWPPDALDALRFVLARLPTERDAWVDAAARCAAVFVAARPADVGGGEPLVLSHGRFYLRRYWQHERRIATQVIARTHVTTVPGGMSAPADAANESVCSLVELLFGQRTGAEPDWQRIAAGVAWNGRFTIVTGGPGTGKTWVAARFVALFLATAHEPKALRIALAAPTGKAAARLKQSIDASLIDLQTRLGTVGTAMPLVEWSARRGPARTLHGLLGRHRPSRRFRHDAGHPLPLDVLIVDEASMIHVEMMDALLDALPPTARLVLLGDKDQLASVEAGAVLGELCRDADAGRYTAQTAHDVAAITAQRIPDALQDAHGPALAQRTVMLRRSERFAGAIGALADAVNAGRIDESAMLLRDDRDASLGWITGPTPDVVLALAMDGRPGAEGFGPYLAALGARPDTLFVEDHAVWIRRVLDVFERFRVLCAVRDGPWGVVATNRAIEERVRGAAGFLPGSAWYEGRAVMVVRNDYDLGVFNGDVGIALRASPHDSELRVHFTDGASLRSVGVSRLSEVESAFATTVHKAQGSEFAHTALVLPIETSRIVTRELLYTGVTRARERFTLVTARDESLAEAIGETTRRSSGIGAMLEARAGETTVPRRDRPSSIA